MIQNSAANEVISVTPAMPATSALTQGRLVGFGMLVSFALGMYSNFQLQSDLFSNGGFMVQAGQQPALVGIIVVLGLITGLISLAIAASVRQRMGPQMPVLSRCYLLLVTAGFAMSQVEHTVLLAMRPVSEAFLAVGPQAAASFELVRELLGGLRNGIHFPDKLVGGLSVFLLFFLLKHARVIPAPLAFAGMVAAACQMCTILRELFGYDIIYALLAPLALIYPATGFWLLIKGFAVKESASLMR
ncbi:DUF4386 family protein [Rheinheimera sp.]|uniref:DUF4386 family protein n=1 Tax=Rheinheimera sp. TaxID=1869214 RepID=UPI003D2AE596